jgi:hypothetical protein
MKRYVALIAAFSIFALSAHGSAAESHRHHAKSYPKHFSYRPDYPRGNGWYPHDADKLPIGSGEWWRQMLRENRVRN